MTGLRLEDDVGDHLVGVHVSGGARAALNHIDDELVMEVAVLGGQRSAARGKRWRRQLRPLPVGTLSRR